MSQRRQSVARHPRSPLPRQQTLREKLKNVQKTPVPAVPLPPSPRTPGGRGAAPAARLGRARTSFCEADHVQ
jgi:hypothetical protein